MEKAREFFGCPDLNGLEIENSARSFSCSILQSHWEKRILNNEIMGAESMRFVKSFISPMTLALLEDSGINICLVLISFPGWYLPNYAMASSAVKDATWGYKQGCDFARDSRCVSPTGSPDEGTFFCARTNLPATCSADRFGVAQCSAATVKAVIGP